MPDTQAAARGLVFALLGAPLLAGAQPASAASFDCRKPDLAADEQAICQNPQLNDMDVKMVTTFDLLSGLLAMGARGDMQDQQIKWLGQRGECQGNVDCIAAAYAVRMVELTNIYEGLQRPK
jgi:uncharacterized protein